MQTASASNFPSRTEEIDDDEENEEIIKNTEESDAESDNNNEEDTDDESDDENDKIYLHANKQTHNRKRKYHEVTENNENIKNKNKNENENEIKHTVKRSKLTSELINDTCKLLSTLLRTLDLLPCIQNVLKNAIAKGWDLTHITDCLWTHVGDEDIDKLSNRPVLAKYFTMQNFEDLVQKMCPDAVPIFVPPICNVSSKSNCGVMCICTCCQFPKLVSPQWGGQKLKHYTCA